MSPENKMKAFQPSSNLIWYSIDCVISGEGSFQSWDWWYVEIINHDRALLSVLNSWIRCDPNWSSRFTDSISAERWDGTRSAKQWIVQFSHYYADVCGLDRNGGAKVCDIEPRLHEPPTLRFTRNPYTLCSCSVFDVLLNHSLHALLSRRGNTNYTQDTRIRSDFPFHEWTKSCYP